MRATIVLVLAAVACAICAVPALGAVKISGSDDDVWNATTTPTYTITGSSDAQIRWALLNGDGDPVAADLKKAGKPPVTITLKGLGDGNGYRLYATQSDDRRPDFTRRRFAVDTTPPRVQIDSPVDGAVYAQGQAVAAGYRCDERMCVGPVPDGAPITTATLGPQSFSVTATDRAGNVVTVTRNYTVAEPGTVRSRPRPSCPGRDPRPRSWPPNPSCCRRPRTPGACGLAWAPSSRRRAPCSAGRPARTRSSTTSRSSGCPASASSRWSRCSRGPTTSAFPAAG